MSNTSNEPAADRNSSAHNPMIAVRGLPIAPTVLVALAMLFHKHESWAGACLGGALGVLIGFCIYTLSSIQEVVLKDTPQPSDVRRYPLT